MIESILKYVEAANKYGFPVPLIILLSGAGFWMMMNTKWPEREKYYGALLTALGQWKNSLADRSTYYMEPGSEYRDDTITVIPRFQTLMKQGGEALAVIRDQIHTGRLFLSDNTIDFIDQMLADHWFISEIDAICTRDYLDKTLELTERTYAAVLADAKRDLRKSRMALIMTKAISK